MIPPVPGGPLGLQAAVLDGEEICIHGPLVHGDAEQPRTALAASRSQLLTCRGHRLVLSLQLEFAGPAQRRLVKVPGPLDGPVAEVARAREAEGPRCQRVVEEVSDQSWRREKQVN